MWIVGFILLILIFLYFYPKYKRDKDLERHSKTNPALLYDYQCPYCGFKFHTALSYCPNCHHEMSYSTTNETVNNYESSPEYIRDRNDVSDSIQSADPIGCALGTFAIMFIILVIMAYVF